MPPPIPSSLLKAVQCRHNSPLLYAYNNTRSIFLSTPSTVLNCNLTPKPNFLFTQGPHPASWRWMRSATGERIRKEAMTSSTSSSPSPPSINGGFKDSDERSNNASPKLLTLPTLLTLGRVAAVPLLVSTFYMNGWWATTATTSIFIAASVTDWLDGYIARRMQLGTAFGAFLDPVADKLMVAATLVLLCTRPLEAAIFEGVPWLLTLPSIAIIGREITMSAVREWAASQSTKVLQAVAVNNLGKWKTATQMIALTILLASRDSSLSQQGVIVASGVTLLYISAGLALWSLYVYMRNIWRILLK